MAPLISNIRELGAEPVLIPPMADVLFPQDRSQRAGAIRAMTSQLDGLAGPGGFDWSPRLYGQPMTHSLPGGHSAERVRNDSRLARGLYARDRFAADFLKDALESKGSYYLGICASHQLLNVLKGGSLYQDILKEGQVGHSHNQGLFGQPHSEAMNVVIDGQRHQHVLHATGDLADRMGATQFATNAYHHQNVKRPGRGLTVVATTHDPETKKDLIEATLDWNALSVQPHPEDRKVDWPVFSAVGRAAAFRALKELSGPGKHVTVEDILRHWTERHGPPNASDERWIRTEFAAHQKLA